MERPENRNKGNDGKKSARGDIHMGRWTSEGDELRNGE